MRNGIETKQLFGCVCIIGMVTSGRMPARDGLVVVSFVGTPLVLRRVLVTPLVLRVPLGKPCDTYLHAGTRCRYVLPGCSLVVSASCTRMGCILYRHGYDSGHTMLTL